MSFPARIVMPASAKKGEVIEIRTLVQHAMEPGYRRDNVGKAVPRDIIASLVVTYDGGEIFKADLQPGTAANPYIAFHTVATATGEVVFTWTDLTGKASRETRNLSVT